MKLKIKSDKIRQLSDVYGISIQEIARKAAISHIKNNRHFVSIKMDGATETVIDVTNEYTPDEWRELIEVYCNREIERLPEVLEGQIKLEKSRADQIRNSLPKYYED